MRALWLWLDLCLVTLSWLIGLLLKLPLLDLCLKPAVPSPVIVLSSSSTSNGVIKLLLNAVETVFPQAACKLVVRVPQSVASWPDPGESDPLSSLSAQSIVSFGDIKLAVLSVSAATVAAAASRNSRLSWMVLPCGGSGDTVGDKVVGGRSSSNSGSILDSASDVAASGAIWWSCCCLWCCPWCCRWSRSILVIELSPKEFVRRWTAIPSCLKWCQRCRDVSALVILIKLGLIKFGCVLMEVIAGRDLTVLGEIRTRSIACIINYKNKKVREKQYNPIACHCLVL